MAANADLLLSIARNRLATRAAMAACYHDSWGLEFAAEEIRKAWLSEDTAESLPVADLMAIPDERLRELGFASWDGALTLIPLWAWNLIADDEELTDISGETKRKGHDVIDLDTRFGCIAYGFKKPSVTKEPA